MNIPKIRIGSRSSRLALLQVEEIKRSLPWIRFETVTFETAGDRDKTTPLHIMERTDFFTADIERALLEGTIDAAVHSAKDLEESPPAALTIAAVTSSISPHECLVSRGDVRLDQLPSGAVVGTSSRKRKAALERFRKDLIVKDIRGNVDERIRKLDEGRYDAIVVAHAALLRLGLNERITQIISGNIVPPHPLQGKLAIQVRKERGDLIRTFRRIDERN